MYLEFYGFKETPFSLSPNPRFIFFSKPHKEVFALLLYGIDRHYGFIQLTGEVGTGKTTVLRTLLSHLDEEKYRTALIFNPLLSPVDLLSAINNEYGIAGTADNCAELLAELNRFLLEENAAGRTVVLIIDEAQNLSPDLLEQVRLISNLETDSQKLIQIVLAGQPELAEILDRPELRQISQRIALRYHLRPLDRDDSEGYIEHRLSLAGGHGLVTFSRWALRLLYHYSRGTPRLINILCDRALLVAYTLNRRKVTARTVALAFRDVMLKPAISFIPAMGWKKPMAMAAAMLVAVALYFLIRDTGPGSGLPEYTGKAEPLQQAAKVGEAGEQKKSSAKELPAVPVAQPVIADDQAAMAGAGKADIGSKVAVARAIEVKRVEKPAPVVKIESSPVKPTEQEAATVLTAAEEARSAVQAFNTVASLIQASPIVRLNGNGAPADRLRNEAVKRGLEMHSFSGSLDQLARSGSPAILDMGPKSGRRGQLVAMTGARNGRVSIYPPINGKSVFSAAEVARSWSGRAYILWRNPDNIRVPLKAGAGGNDVIRLQILLQSAVAPGLEVNGIFDDGTLGAVKEFQRSRGIDATGKVGPMTLMMLYRAVKGKRLAGNANESGEEGK